MVTKRFVVVATGAVLFITFVLFTRLVLPGLLQPQGNEGTPVGIPDPGAVYDPVVAGEPVPERFRQLISRDGIRPIYAPRFVPAERAGYPGDSLVLGVALNGEAHAYPIGVLNWREMVIDEVGGVPILATW